MSFDLFVIAPKIDREVAEKFNAFKHPGLPEGLSIDLEQCQDDANFWTIKQNGEEWAELHIDRAAKHDYSHLPADIAADWVEVHIPSRGHPMVFHAVAALAEAAQGWVFDPQGICSEVSIAIDEVQAKNVESGFYTPATTREIAEVMAKMYKWD
ncbi:MAG: hypothetical protein ACREPB_09320 [Arenimonas sp.]